MADKDIQATAKVQSRIPVELFEQVEGYARYNGMSTSEAVRRLIALGLEYDGMDALATPVGQAVSTAMAEFVGTVGAIVEDRMAEAALDSLRINSAAADASMASLSILNKISGGSDDEFDRLLLVGANIRSGMGPEEAEEMADEALSRYLP